MWNLFKRKCKHKNFEAIESLIWQGGLLYNRLIVYKCDRCEVFAYTDSFAFVRGSGALDLYRPKHKDYTEHGSVPHKLSNEQSAQLVKDMLEKYF